MPTVAKWIDGLREVFGADSINEAIRAGIGGRDVFFAAENGHEVGTRPGPAGLVVSGEALFSHIPIREKKPSGR